MVVIRPSIQAEHEARMNRTTREQEFLGNASPEYSPPPATIKVETQTTRRVEAEVLGRRLTVADLDDLVAACKSSGVPGNAEVHFGSLESSNGLEAPHNWHTARGVLVLDSRTGEAPPPPPVRCGECQMGLGVHNPKSPACAEYTPPVEMDR